MALKCCSNCGSTFKVDKSDVRVIKTSQISQKLPVPYLIGSGECFKNALNVDGQFSTRSFSFNLCIAFISLFKYDISLCSV